VKGGTDALNHLLSGEQATGFNHFPFLVKPLRSDRVGPDAPRRQQKQLKANTFASAPDLLIVLTNPGPMSLTSLSGGGVLLEN
jgi:hypothetical protein